LDVWFFARKGEFAFFEFFAEIGNMIFSAEPLELMFFFVFKNGVIKILGFVAAEGFHDGVFFVADGYFNRAVFGITTDEDIDARRIETKVFDGIIIDAVNQFKVRVNGLFVPNVIFHETISFILMLGRRRVDDDLTLFSRIPVGLGAKRINLGSGYIFQ